jgi:hypothetical protein
MCGRFTITEIERVRARFGVVRGTGELAARFNVAHPTAVRRRPGHIRNTRSSLSAGEMLSMKHRKE